MRNGRPTFIGRTLAAVSVASVLVAASCSAAEQMQGPAVAVTTKKSTTGLFSPEPVASDHFAVQVSKSFGTDVVANPFTDLGTSSTESDIAFGSMQLRAVPDSGQDILVLSLRPTTNSAAGAAPLAQAPASRITIGTFSDIVNAAMTDNVQQGQKGDVAGSVNVIYQAASPTGGSITINVEIDALGSATATVSGQTADVIPTGDKVLKPAYSGIAYEKLTVQTDALTNSDYVSFFGGRALRRSGGNLPPVDDVPFASHDWLRVTATPNTSTRDISLAVATVSTGGDRTELGSAAVSLVDASAYLDQVRTLAVASAAAQKAAATAGPTSKAAADASVSWSAPLAATAEQNGDGAATDIDVVIKGGANLTVSLSVSVQRDVIATVDPIVRSDKVEVQPPSKVSDEDCSALNSSRTGSGTFNVAFRASPTLKATLGNTPIRGDVFLSAYPQVEFKDGSIRPGATTTASLRAKDVDITKGTSQRYLLDHNAEAGVYDFIGFMDINGNADPKQPSPDLGDPIIVPVSGYTLACTKQPVDVEFAMIAR